MITGTGFIDDRWARGSAPEDAGDREVVGHRIDCAIKHVLIAALDLFAEFIEIGRRDVAQHWVGGLRRHRQHCQLGAGWPGQVDGLAERSLGVR